MRGETNEDGYVYSEARLAQVLGVARKKLPRFDYTWKEMGGEIRLTLEGVIRVMEGLGQEVAYDLEYVSKKALVPGLSPPLVPKKARLMVTQVTRNRHIVLAQENPDQDEQRVQVRDGRKFAVGMVLECQHVEDDLWELIGRAPRGPRDGAMMEGGEE